jgi:hypothetical protein
MLRHQSGRTTAHRRVPGPEPNLWKLGTVAEEIDESVYWLEFMSKAGLAQPGMLEPLLSESRELRSIFAASYRTARRNRRGGK